MENLLINLGAKQLEKTKKKNRVDSFIWHLRVIEDPLYMLVFLIVLGEDTALYLIKKSAFSFRQENYKVLSTPDDDGTVVIHRSEKVSHNSCLYYFSGG